MYFPKIVIYQQNMDINECSALLGVFQRVGFHPFVDGRNGMNLMYLKDLYKNAPHRVYLMNQTLEEYFIGTVPAPPHFSVSYNNSDEITGHDWHLITRYVCNLLFPLESKPKIVSRRAKVLLNVPMTQNMITEEEMKEDLPEGYEYDFHLEKDQNVGFAQVKKPYTDRPYTVVIRNFDKRGYEPLFAGLFVSSSWGVCKYDILFLSKLWEFLEMKEPFDLDALLERETQKCYPSENGPGAPEPEVYRRTIEQVINQFREKQGLLIKHDEA